MELWSVGIFLSGCGILLYCIVLSVAALLNAHFNGQAVDVLNEIHDVLEAHGVDPNNKNSGYQPD